MTKETKPAFVSAVGPEPASYLQESYLIDGKVITFRQPVQSPDVDAIQDAHTAIIAEVLQWGK